MRRATVCRGTRTSCRRSCRACRSSIERPRSVTRRGRPTLTSSEPSAASREVAEGLLSRRPTDEIRAFYDQLAPDYTALFRDWDASVVRQGEILERLIAAGLPGYVAPATTRVLDATCG